MLPPLLPPPPPPLLPPPPPPLLLLPPPPLLLLQSASNPNCPRARCPIAKPGQSGQPEWTSVSSNYQIHGVLSYGPYSYTTCTDWDVHTELDSINYNFLNTRRNYT